ncbi:MAG TPA: NAD(P)-dependent oxidoreductase [Acidimicrobiales bacterium]|nr:NAD(P)-dependent oxidoreductase [Acidimicrobiales bacterium]
MAAVPALSQVPPRPEHRAFVTAPLRGPGLAKLQSLATVVHEPWIDQVPLRIYDAAGLAERASGEGADILVVESDLVAGPVFDLPLLAVAATRGNPTNVDLAAATEAGVPVLHTPGRNADAVAELTVALLFAVARRVVVADGEVRAGRVFADGTIPYQRHRTWEIAGRTAGLVGLGAVGRAVKWRLVGLGMNVIACDPANPEAHHGFDDLLAVSDVVSVHAQLDESTRSLVDAKALAAMRDGAILINTARGALVDTDALVDALAVGKLAGAGIDHVEGEVLPEGHRLLSMPEVVFTPHIGGATYDTERRGAEMVAGDVERLICGEPPRYCANPEVLAKSTRGRRTR